MNGETTHRKGRQNVQKHAKFSNHISNMVSRAQESRATMKHSILQKFGKAQSKFTK